MFRFASIVKGVRTVIAGLYLLTCAATPAFSQAILYVTEDRTISQYGYDQVYVGVDADQNAYPGVTLNQDGAGILDRLIVRHGGTAFNRQGYLNIAELHEDSTLYVLGTPNAIKAYDASAVYVYYASGALDAYNTSSVSLIGPVGSAGFVTLHDGATLDAEESTYCYQLQLNDQSVANISSATFSSIVTSGNSVLNLNATGDYGNLAVYMDGGTLNLNQGRLKEIKGYRSGKIQVSGGTISHLDLTPGSIDELTVSGGGVDSVSAGGGMIFATITGGRVGLLDSGEDGWANYSIQGGSIGTLIGDSGVSDISGGAIDRLLLKGVNSQQTAMRGGLVGDLTLNGESVFGLYGGQVSEITLNDNAALYFSGGILGENSIGALSSSVTVNIYGRNLSYSPIPTTGKYHGFDGFFWTLTGTLSSGEKLDTRYFVPGAATDAPVGLTLINAAPAAPEPGTIPLLASGVFCAALRACKTRKRRIAR